MNTESNNHFEDEQENISVSENNYIDDEKIIFDQERFAEVIFNKIFYGKVEEDVFCKKYIYAEDVERVKERFKEIFSPLVSIDESIRECLEYLEVDECEKDLERFILIAREQTLLISYLETIYEKILGKLSAINRHLRKRIKLWYNKVKSCIYPEIMSNIVEYIHNNPEESQRLLGLHYEQLKQLIEKAIELHNNKKELAESKKVRLILGGSGRKPKLTPESQIILTLTYLRHLTTFQLLGIQFGVSETTANDTFNYWFPLLGELLPPSLISQVKKTPTTTKLLKNC
ncbi:MAG: transposase family protein [Sphaerospermopsis kisseleviana]